MKNILLTLFLFFVPLSLALGFDDEDDKEIEVITVYGDTVQDTWGGFYSGWSGVIGNMPFPPTLQWMMIMRENPTQLSKLTV